MEKVASSPEIEILLRVLDQAFDRRAWHGPNLRGSLRGLTARESAWRPAPGRHNIWELTLHCAYWKYCSRRLLLGEKRGNFPLEGNNFFKRPDTRKPGDAEWQRDIELLTDEHRQLRAAVAGFPAARLERRASPNGWTFFETIVGAASHDLYHAGQIRLLRRLQKG